MKKSVKAFAVIEFDGVCRFVEWTLSDARRTRSRAFLIGCKIVPCTITYTVKTKEREMKCRTK